MIKIENKKDCSGCYACENICPKKCISMIPDKEGFWYPVVDEKNCIDCNLCIRSCPIINKTQVINNPISYGAYNKNKSIRKKSSSGGIFTLIAEEVINREGVVVGACFDEVFNVKHKIITKKEDLHILRGSKYVQSKIGNTYNEIKICLEEGKDVLFTGTPCQIAGLKTYLGKDYQNLICQDIICHGVPSPKVWNKYRDTIANQNKLVNMSFRDKLYGWKNYSLYFKFDDNHEYNEIAYNNKYMKGFIKDVYIRPSCHECNYKTIHRNSDITLADFWGIQNILPELDDDIGTSLVLVNSKKGNKLFEDIQNKMVYKEVDINEALKYNPSAIKSASKHPKRDVFMREIDNKDFNSLMNKYCSENVVIRVKILLHRIVSKLKK